MFQAVYDSALHHPGVAWIGAATLLAWLAARGLPQGLPRWALPALVALTALDAGLTGAWSPLPASLAQPVAIVFVVLGDLRLFALTEAWRDGPGRGPSTLARALGLALVVPVAQAILIRALPSLFAEPRAIFLAYELLAVGFLAGYRTLRLRPDGRPELDAARAAALVFLGMYLLWVTADVLLLLGHEWALLLRLVPNAIYYAGFPWTAALLARRAEAT